jgi:hypothetical protein
MNHDEQMAIAISFVISPVLFAIFAVIAFVQRGYFAIGGEGLALLLPLYVYAFVMMRASHAR